MMDIFPCMYFSTIFLLWSKAIYTLGLECPTKVHVCEACIPLRGVVPSVSIEILEVCSQRRMCDPRHFLFSLQDQ